MLKIRYNNLHDLYRHFIFIDHYKIIYINILSINLIYNYLYIHHVLYLLFHSYYYIYHYMGIAYIVFINFK